MSLTKTGYRPLVTLEDMEVPDFARDVVAMMQLLVWVMAGIASLSVVGAALLTAREQAREVATRKALVAAMAGVMGLEGMALAQPGSLLLFAVGLGIGLAALAALLAAVWGARLVTASALHAE